MSGIVGETVSVAKLSFAQAPIQHVASAAAITTGATVETVSPLAPYIAWMADGAIIMGFLLPLSLFALTLLKIRSQIRGE